MEKSYGYCTILGDGPDSKFQMLIEYSHHQEGKFFHYLIGKDIITGTPVFSIPFRETKSLDIAAENDRIKRGKLITNDYWNISRNEMSERLSKLTKEDIEVYVSRIKHLKEKYLEAAHNAKVENKKNKLEEKNRKKSFMSERRRLVRLARTIK